MAAPTYVNKSAFASGTGELSVGAVASVVADDLILLFIESANQAATMSSPWVEVPSSPQGTGTAGAAAAVRLTIYYQFATGADSTTTVADTGDHTTAIKMAFRGVDKTSPFNANTGSTTLSAAGVFPAVSTSVADCLVVLSIAHTRDAGSTDEIAIGSNANLSSITERHDQTVASGTGGGFSVFTGVKATAGSTGTTPFTYVNNSTTSTGIVLALAPVIIKVIADPATYSFTGTAANTLFNRKVAADQGSFALAGTDATFSIGAAPNNYSITADSVAFALTRTDANLNNNRVLGADTVSFALTGQAAGLARGYVMPADTLSCVLSGTDAGLRVNRVIVAASGSFNESVTDAGLLYGYAVTADSVSFTLTGTDAALVKASPGSLTLIADSAAYSVVGNDASQLYGRNLGADPSTYALVGTDAVLSKSGLGSYTLSVDSGSFALAGSDATLLASGDQATVVRGRVRFDEAMTEWEARRDFRKQAVQIIERLDEAPQEAPVTVEAVAEVAPRFSLVEAMSEGVELGLDIDPILLALQARNAMQAEQNAMSLMEAIEQEREAIALAWFMAEAA